MTRNDSRGRVSGGRVSDGRVSGGRVSGGSGSGSCPNHRSVSKRRNVERRRSARLLQYSNLFALNKLPVLLRYVSLPEHLSEGSFNAVGDRIPADSSERPVLVLTELGGGIAWQCWAAFDRLLQPGQYGLMVMRNVAGFAPLGGAFTEWNGRLAEPFYSDKLLTIHSVQRARDAARIIGRNSSNQAAEAAAGILYSPPLDRGTSTI